MKLDIIEKSLGYINLRDLTENASHVVPGFNPDLACDNDKEAQWLYYFAQHPEEVEEILTAEYDRLEVRLRWMQEYMPSYAKAIASNGVMARSYIRLGNKLLRRLFVECHKPPKNAHIRFPDSKSLDAWAAIVREGEQRDKRAFLILSDAGDHNRAYRSRRRRRNGKKGRGDSNGVVLTILMRGQYD